MSREALPCIACGATLVNVFDADNQPQEGLAFTSNGHYGGTAFDPMDGSFIEVNVCDPCLIAAGEQGRVLAARTKIPVYADGFFVGHAPADYKPVPWRQGLPADDKRLELELEDVGNEELFPEIDWDTRQLRFFRQHRDELLAERDR